jgi:tetratricopeptide (TPR) repeat protein
VKKYDEIIRTRPNEAQGYVGKAHYLIKLGRYDDALKPLDKAARLDPRDAEVHFRMGYCFSMLNRQKEALTAYNNSLQLKQTDQVCYNIANTLSLLGKYDDALRYYEHTLKINPKY